MADNMADNPEEFARQFAPFLKQVIAESVPDTPEARTALRILIEIAAKHIGGFGDYENANHDWHRRLELVRKMVREYTYEEATDIFIEISCSGGDAADN